uniref:Uncharacterized protein n=1 Tax=Clastoptera arizonana TaxID=38151 RepID=A0A1B6C7S2_9HEMI
MKAQNVFSFIILLTVLNLSHTEKTELDILHNWTFTQINKLWQNFTDISWLNEISKHGRTDIRLLKAFGTICDRLDKYVPQRIPETLAFESIWSHARIETEAKGILGMYNNFRKYQDEVKRELSSRYSYSRMWQDFAETILEDSDTVSSIPRAIDSINALIHFDPKKDDSYFNVVLQETDSKLCHVEQSPHQVLFNLYNSLQLTQLKGYTMMEFSWMLLRLYNKGEFTVESKLMRERYMERMTNQVKSIKEALKLADQSYWKCDPKKHVEGETYVQLTRLLQGYLQNEIDMNPKQSCSENCGFYSFTKQYGCYKNEFCSKQRSCKGDIVDCQFIDSDMWVCQDDPRKSSRRYAWINYENGRTLGNKDSCYRINKVDSWWYWIFWHCSYCFCLCDDKTNSDRYFNIRQVVSNVEKNKVVVGIRFVKNNGIIHLQIQEGDMLPFASVNDSSIQWKPVDDYTIKNEGVKEGVDYLMLSYKNRAIDFDDLKAPEGYVVTGVKFRSVGSHVNLEIQASPFNFTTGQLDHTKSMWISNDNTDGNLENPRTEIKINSADNPIHSLTSSTMESKHDQYLLFTHSDIDLDVAQTTIPFIDAQTVAPQPPTLLSGIGLYYKRKQWFGGFIGPKVFTYDPSRYLQDTFPELNEAEHFNVGGK